MVIGDIQRTRRLAGNPSSTNVSDADITQGLAYGTSQVIAATNKDDWDTDTSNDFYPTAVMAAVYFASSMIRDRFNDQVDISTEHYNRATALITQIAEVLASSGEGGGGSGSGSSSAIASRQYRTYPLNPNAPVYRSMTSQGQTLIGVETYTNIPQ